MPTGVLVLCWGPSVQWADMVGVYSFETSGSGCVSVAPRALRSIARRAAPIRRYEALPGDVAATGLGSGPGSGTPGCVPLVGYHLS